MANKKSKKSTAEPTTIRLNSTLNLTMAHALHEQLVSAVENNDHLILDGTDVELMTTPCLQVVLSAGQTCEGAGQTFSITNPSEAFSIAFNDLGLDTYLERWSSNNE